MQELKLPVSKLRVLMAHNFYGSESPSGENMVVKAERKMLEINGHQVDMFSTNSDDIRTRGLKGLIKGGLLTPWNPAIVNLIREKIRTFRPDIVHIHNTFPLISPAIFYAIDPKIPKVLTVHNYRLFCPAGIPVRNGLVCTECLDKKSALPSLLHGCYRGSRIATLPLAFSVQLHRAIGTWNNQGDGFITLTDFQREKLSSAGLPLNKIYIKPNMVSAKSAVRHGTNKEDYVVFVGRLSAEKGVISLLRAWKLMANNYFTVPELRIIGDGPLRAQLEEMATDLPVYFYGQVASEEALIQIANSKLLILPSECFEGFPMVICEAYALGTPVAASNIGSLSEIVKKGVCGDLFEPANTQSICTVVTNLWNDQEYLERLAQGARMEYEKNYTEKSNYFLLMEIYSKIINQKEHLNEFMES